MRKIPTLFVRDFDSRQAYVTDQVTPGCEWVMKGHGTPTRKYDGTCLMFDGERWWARREVKPGKEAPPNFVEVEHDETTEKTVGWEPVEQSGFARWHAEAVANAEDENEPGSWPVGTYELIGPKINGNREREDIHTLLLHANAEECYIPFRTFEVIRDQVMAFRRLDGCEGVVFHHPDGRMAKIKARDFRP